MVSTLSLHEILLSKVISPKVAILPSGSRYKAVLNIDRNLSRYSTFWVRPHYRPMRQIRFYAMGHCVQFSYTLWVTSANLVTRYWPLCRMKLYSKNLWQFPRCGPLRSICSDLWATHKILLCALGHIAGFWLCSMDLSVILITAAQNSTTVFEKLCHIL